MTVESRFKLMFSCHTSSNNGEIVSLQLTTGVAKQMNLINVLVTDHVQ